MNWTMITSRSRNACRELEGAAKVCYQSSPCVIPYASCYTYSPRGQSEASVRSRWVRDNVKAGGLTWLRCCATRVFELAEADGRLSGFFASQSVLIPVPQSPSCGRASPWVAWRLARQLHMIGLGGGVCPVLRRCAAVRRSSVAWMWERPTVGEHFDSFEVIADAAQWTELVLIDDVVTKGRTLMAAALRLRQAFPDARVRAFALMRTLGMVPEVRRILDPCVGEIHWNGREAYRDP